MEACGIHETTYNSIISATLTSGGTCTPTPSCPEAPPCTLVLLTVCRRRSPPWLPPPSRSRSSLPPRGSTPSGSEAPSSPPSPLSSRCGSPSRSTTSPAPALFTGNASKLKQFLTTTTPFFMFNNFNDWFMGKVHNLLPHHVPSPALIALFASSCIVSISHLIAQTFVDL